MYLLYALGVFAVAAIGGLIMANNIFNGKLAPWPLSLLHAALGATGLVLVLLAVMSSMGQAASGAGGNAGIITAGILLVTALGGFFLASFHLRSKLAPGGIVILHASLGILGVLMIVLLAFVLNANPDLSDVGAVAPNLR